ncbi:Condensin-2 complex subunit D3, partial [Dissostichus eleginoides]
MDLKGLRLNNLSGFYGGLFKVWGLLRRERPECCGSLFWLLRELVVRGSRFVCEVGPSLQQRLCEERILTLGQVVEVCGPRLDNAAGLASRLSLRSVRVVSLLLQSWKQQLSQSELALIAAHCNGLKSPNDNDSFPEMRCFPDLSCGESEQTPGASGQPVESPPGPDG